MPRPTEQRIYSAAELQAELDEILGRPTIKERNKGGVELHGKLHRAVNANPEKQERDALLVVARSLMKLIFEIEDEDPCPTS